MPNHPKACSTTQRRGKTFEALGGIGPLDDGLTNHALSVAAEAEALVGQYGGPIGKQSLRINLLSGNRAIWAEFARREGGDCAERCAAHPPGG